MRPEGSLRPPWLNQHPLLYSTLPWLLARSHRRLPWSGSRVFPSCAAGDRQAWLPAPRTGCHVPSRLPAGHLSFPSLPGTLSSGPSLSPFFLSCSSGIWAWVVLCLLLENYFYLPSRILFAPHLGSYSGTLYNRIILELGKRWEI